MGIRLMKNDFFVDEDTVILGDNEYPLVRICFENTPLIIIKAAKGYVATTHLDRKKIETLGEIACFISPVMKTNSLRKSKIKEVTSWAEDIGIKQGMTLKRALEILNGRE